MTKRHHPSDLDFSTFTWEMIFKEIDISENSTVARRWVVAAPLIVTYSFFWYSRILEIDNPPQILYYFMEGTHEGVLKIFWDNDEEIVSKIKYAVSKLVMTAHTKRSRLEKTCPSPSECGKLDIDFPHVSAHRSGSGLHVSLQVQAFGNFLEEPR